MARRRAVERPASPASLPPGLRAADLVVEAFVDWSERPPPYQPPDHDMTWRRITALRRWQGEITKWAGASGLEKRDVREAGLWPIRPPRFRSIPAHLKGQEYD